jgi:DNA gyrase subunit A
MRTYTGEEDILLITNEGIIIRFSAEDISKTGRDTQGVRLMRLDEEQFISTMSIVYPDDEDEEGTEAVEDQEQDPDTEMPNLEGSDRPAEVDELIGRAEADFDSDDEEDKE